MISINVKLESRPAQDCFKIALNCLELARRAEEDWEIEHHSITGITFVAFSIEAMLNHFGLIYYKDWNEQKGRREVLYKKLFKAVNLPCYLGSTEYQNAKYCFKLRDLLAHGKTKSETLEFKLPKGTHKKAIFNQMTSLPSEAFREANYVLLKKFVKTARDIEKDIESNGFYPNQEHIEIKLRSKLCERPLSCSGVRCW